MKFFIVSAELTVQGVHFKMQYLPERLKDYGHLPHLLCAINVVENFLQDEDDCIRSLFTAPLHP